MAAPIKPHCLLACKLSKCDHLAEQKSFISVATSDSISDVFNHIHNVYSQLCLAWDCDPERTTEKFQVGDFISLLGLGKGGAVNADTCYLWVIVPSFLFRSLSSEIFFSQAQVKHNGLSSQITHIHAFNSQIHNFFTMLVSNLHIKTCK